MSQHQFFFSHGFSIIEITVTSSMPLFFVDFSSSTQFLYTAGPAIMYYTHQTNILQLPEHKDNPIC
jgi:hypothetical protein